MRSSLFRELAILVLALAVCRSPAFAERTRAKPLHRPEVALKGFEEEGYGVTNELARRDALEKLSADVIAWLGVNHPEITYTPTPADVESMAREYTEPEPWSPKKNSELTEPMVVVKLKAELTNSHLQTFEAQTLYQVAQHRQYIMARGLAGAFALLAVGTGYLRLEEKMGRHKRKLGVAVGLLGLVGLTVLAFGFNFF
jgi:hypothetical protein